MTAASRLQTQSAVLITATEPGPRSYGKQVVIGGLLDHLCLRLGADRVHVVLIGRPDIDRPPTPYGLHVIGRPTAAEQLRAVARRVVLPPHTPLQEAALWSPRLLARLREVLDDLEADLEIFDTMRTGQYAPLVGGQRRILYADDLFSKRYASMLERDRQDPTPIRNPLGEFAKLLPGPAGRLAASRRVYRPLLQVERRLAARSEVAAPRQFDATVLVSAVEAAELRQRTGLDSVRALLPLLPPSAPTPRSYSGPPTFVFLGGLDFAPNCDGLTWFLEHCREAVLAAVPDFRLLVIGRGSILGLPSAARDWGDRVRALGWVEDLDEVLSSSAGLLSVLRIGSGIKIKVLEALARGLPVVATPHGVLGLEVDRADGCLVGQTPAALAALLAEAAQPDANAILSRAARVAWDRRFDPEVASRAYDELLWLPGRQLVAEHR